MFLSSEKAYIDDDWWAGGKSWPGDPVMSHGVAKRSCTMFSSPDKWVALGSVTPPHTAWKEERTCFPREMDSAYWCSRVWQTEQIRAPFRQKRLLGVSLASGMLLSPHLRDKGEVKFLVKLSPRPEVLVSLPYLLEVSVLHGKEVRPCGLLQTALVEVVGVIGCQHCPSC